MPILEQCGEMLRRAQNGLIITRAIGDLIAQLNKCMVECDTQRFHTIRKCKHF